MLSNAIELSGQREGLIIQPDSCNLCILETILSHFDSLHVIVKNSWNIGKSNFTRLHYNCTPELATSFAKLF